MFCPFQVAFFLFRDSLRPQAPFRKARPGFALATPQLKPVYPAAMPACAGIAQHHINGICGRSPKTQAGHECPASPFPPVRHPYPASCAHRHQPVFSDNTIRDKLPEARPPYGSTVSGSLLCCPPHRESPQAPIGGFGADTPGCPPGQSKQATVSTCAVCGNRLMMPAQRKR